MIKLGITGSIGMGKSTIAQMFADEGVPLWSADDCVHRLYATNEQLRAQLVEVFGDILSGVTIDRVRLMSLVRQTPDGLVKLNAIVHPLVSADRGEFEASQQAKGAKITLSDIPLLFETGAQTRLDKVVVVTAPFETQSKRVLSRPNMTQEKFDYILSQQMSDAEKRRRADFVIDTSMSLDACRKAVREILKKLLK